MTSSVQLPIIYIIHGSWHTPEGFTLAIDRLNALGYEVVCPQQPSNGRHSGKLSMYDDAAMTRANIERLIKPRNQGGQGRDVAVVMHSYGGIVGTEACAGLGKADQQRPTQPSDENNRQGSVISLLYAASFVLPIGSSLCTPLGGNTAPFIDIDDTTGLSNPHLLPQAPTPENPRPEPIKTPDAPNHLFYNDLSHDVAAYYTSLLLPQSARTQRDPLTQAAYLDIPTSYLFCENDQALPLFVQKAMVESTNELLLSSSSSSASVDGMATAAMATAKVGKKKIREFTCTAGHSPFLSQPDLFADVVVKSTQV